MMENINDEGIELTSIQTKSDDFNSNLALISASSLTPIPTEEWDVDESDVLATGILPYQAIYKPFENRWLNNRHQYWLIGKRVKCLINKVDAKSGRFIIEMQHGEFNWNVYRSYLDFRALHFGLLIYKHKKKVVARDYSPKLPPLPPFYKAFQKNYDHAFMAKLEAYLKIVLESVELRNNINTLYFCQVSFLSFDRDYGIQKGVEAFGQKRPGGYYGYVVQNFFRRIFMCWQKRWLVLKDSYIAYINTDSQRVGGVLVMDESMKAHLITGTRLLIKNKSRIFRLKFSDARVAKAWLSEILEKIVKYEDAEDEVNLVKNISRPVSSDNATSRINRYQSFVSPKPNSYGYWFVDGSGYFTALAEALYSAKKDIFICDWWLTPELFLKRPLFEGCDAWRFDVILKRKAEEGVQIYVLIYKEISVALGLNSLYTETFLQNLHPYNIHVLRHPNHVLSSVYLWSHHEKIVCIDQRIAFLGGLDISYGRWDDQEHRLTDLGEVSLEKMIASQALPLPKSLYSLTTPKAILKDQKVLRAENMAAPNIKDRFSSTKQRISAYFGNCCKKNNKNTFEVNRGYVPDQDGRMVASQKTGRSDESKRVASINVRGADPTHDHVDLADLDFIGSGRYWIGKDYSNIIYKDFENVDQPFTELIDRRKIPRLPWHDIGVMIYGKPARDVSRHFIERWNQTVVEIDKKNADYPLLLPKSYQALPPLPQVVTKRAIECEIQNQFFVTIHGNHRVLNKIADALYDRIARAVQLREKFRVYIVLPLLPGFEGQIGATTGTFIQALIYWTNASLSMGENSLIQRLKALGIDPSEYVSVCGLRKYAMLDNKLVTELIYVHSKLLIVDDDACIIGSANINDRSMLGDRDSEIAAIFKDTIQLDGIMNGVAVKIGPFASSLRKKIFREHLFGNIETKMSLDDITSDRFYKFWNSRGQINTDIYEQVFNVIPTNHVRSINALNEYKKEKPLAETDIEKGREILQQGIRGHLTKFPLNFLIDEGEKLLTIPQSRLVAPLGTRSPFNALYT